jgi:hypothetical protein
MVQRPGPCSPTQAMTASRRDLRGAGGGEQVSAGEGAVERVGELEVPVTDHAARGEVHVRPALQDGERGRVGVEAGAEVGEQQGDAREAAGAEPVLGEGALGGDRVGTGAVAASRRGTPRARAST